MPTSRDKAGADDDQGDYPYTDSDDNPADEFPDVQVDNQEQDSANLNTDAPNNKHGSKFFLNFYLTCSTISTVSGTLGKTMPPLAFVTAPIAGVFGILSFAGKRLYYKSTHKQTEEFTLISAEEADAENQPLIADTQRAASNAADKLDKVSAACGMTAGILALSALIFPPAAPILLTAAAFCMSTSYITASITSVINLRKSLKSVNPADNKKNAEQKIKLAKDILGTIGYTLGILAVGATLAFPPAAMALLAISCTCLAMNLLAPKVATWWTDWREKKTKKLKSETNLMPTDSAIKSNFSEEESLEQSLVNAKNPNEIPEYTEENIDACIEEQEFSAKPEPIVDAKLAKGTISKLLADGKDEAKLKQLGEEFVLQDDMAQSQLSTKNINPIQNENETKKPKPGSPHPDYNGQK